MESTKKNVVFKNLLLKFASQGPSVQETVKPKIVYFNPIYNGIIACYSYTPCWMLYQGPWATYTKFKQNPATY